MGNNSKHTEGRMEAMGTGMNQYILSVNGMDVFKSFATVRGSQQEPNAERIVTMWNNWDDVVKALEDLVYFTEHRQYNERPGFALDQAKDIISKLSS